MSGGGEHRYHAPLPCSATMSGMSGGGDLSFAIPGAATRSRSARLASKTKGLPENLRKPNRKLTHRPRFVRKLARRPCVVIPPAIWCDRASKQRPQATSQVAQKRIKSQAKSGQSCCGQAACATERASLAACGRPAFATGLEDRRTSQKHTSAFHRFRIKMVEESVAEKWARNLAHTPGCSFKFREGLFFDHESWPAIENMPQRIAAPRSLSLRKSSD